MPNRKLGFTIYFVSTEEGQAYLEADSIYHYNYDLRDYLGNVRASLDVQSEKGTLKGNDLTWEFLKKSEEYLI